MNYQQFAQKPNEEKDVAPQLTEEVDDTSMENYEPVEGEDEDINVKPGQPIIVEVTNCVELNVRKSASRDSGIICTIKKGERVVISPIHDVEIDDGWAHIQLKDGTYGYVMGEFIKEV